MTRFTIGLILSLLSFNFQATAQSAKITGHAVHYYNGNQRVDLLLALDEIRLIHSPTKTLSLSAIKSAVPEVVEAKRTRGSRKMTDITLNPSKDTKTLQDLVAKLVLQTGTDSAEAVLYSPQAGKRNDLARQSLTNQLSVKLREGVDIQNLLKEYGLEMVEKVSYGPRTYILETTSSDLLRSLEVANEIYEDADYPVEFSTPLIRRQRQLRFTPNDTLYGNQWHLTNTGAQVAPSTAGEDVNVETAWDNYTGNGVNISVVDDGFQHAHPDLAANARTDIDIDITDGDNDSTPVEDPETPGFLNSHGTNVGGIAAGVGNNMLGVAGAAFEAGLVGIKVIDGPGTDSAEAQALNHQVNPAAANDRIHISNNSWGPDDGNTTPVNHGPLVGQALLNGIQNGRGGLGTIYVWACGNGACANDRSDYDGYGSSRYTIAVAASGADGTEAIYSEPGAGVLVNTPSEDAPGCEDVNYGTTTTAVVGEGDVMNDYTSSFGGTSSAAPLAAGVIGLILEANPNLTWRDVQHILVQTSVQNAPSDGSWQTNSAGHTFSHRHGHGRADATAATNAAAGWTNIPAPATSPTVTDDTQTDIPDNNAGGITRSLAINAPANFVVEHVELTVDIIHDRRGDLDITMNSPSGMVSTFAANHTTTGANGIDYNNWTFTSVAHWCENPSGQWTVNVSDRRTGMTGMLSSVMLTVCGYVGTGPPTATPTSTDSPVSTATSTNTEPILTATASGTATSPQATETSTSPASTNTPTQTSIAGIFPTVLDPRADVNQDGFVNHQDILILLENWRRINSL